MSGLFQKDFSLLMQRKSSMVIMLFIGVLMGFTMEGSFVIGYISLLTAILSISTISYDEFDNGYPFMMTLPITRNMYVQSKYLFSFVIGIIGWIFAITVFITVNMTRGITLTGNDFLEALVFIPIFCLIFSVMLPFQLKFGAEGSRIVMAIVGGCIAMIVFLGIKIAPEGIKLPTFITDASTGIISVIIFAVTVIAVAISYICSLHVMNNKTF